MSIKLAPLTFEGGVNLKADPHLLKPNEWLKLQNMWPYKDKFIGTRPSLLHEQDILPVPLQNWDSRLYLNAGATNPTAVPNYGQWFRYLTPLRALFLGTLDNIVMICVVNAEGLRLKERFETDAADTYVDLAINDVVVIMCPNDLVNGDTGDGHIYPAISGVRLGYYTNITPSLIEFNGTIIAANKTCDYVVKIVTKDSIVLPAIPSATVWPGIAYRFTKIDFGPTNLDFKVDGVIVYKNRFVYWQGNKVWFSDPFQPEKIYTNARTIAYLGVFFNTGMTEDITAMGIVYMSDKDQIAQSKLAIWTKHSMLTLAGEPATTIAATPEEIWTPIVVSDINIPSGCVSAASVVKTKYGLVWCGAESVWFMQGDTTPVEVGYKIGPRIAAQSFESAGRIFATFDDLCYRLVINAPGVGFNPYDALNEMWCLSFNGDLPNKDNAAWFGPQVFTNSDNQTSGGTPAPSATNAGLYCCAKLTNINDDKTWYIQPYSCPLGVAHISDAWGTRLGLASISTYLGVDITAPFRPVTCLQDDYAYDIGAIFHAANGNPNAIAPYMVEYIVTVAGTVLAVTLQYVHIYTNDIGDELWCKRPLNSVAEDVNLMPAPYKVSLQSANLTFDNPELEKLIDGYELTFKTLNPVIFKSWWAPWQPTTVAANNVTLESKSRLASSIQNVLGNLLNEPVLTSRLISAPPNKRFNGLEAQLNIEDSQYKIVAADTITNPNWNKIRIGHISGGILKWKTFNLFDFDTKGIAKYVTISELYDLLVQKTFVATTDKTLEFNVANGGNGMRYDDSSPLYIDLSYQGWEWFGFVPTGRDDGNGVNIITNYVPPFELGGSYIYPTGPAPAYTPHDIHFVKLNVRYDVFEARPR